MRARVRSGRDGHARKENFLIAHQLHAARAAHWRQQQSPILTLDDAERWLEQHPLCLYLPRHAQLPAPAPSFVEACMGIRHATPPPAAIAHAQGLLTRLIVSGAVVPLNLLGAVGEQPDFLAHRDALPYILSLRADPNWKHAPQKSSGHKVSPLVLELWRALDKEGALTAAEARETLGRELTEAAVLRALCELWQALRISPQYAEEGQPTRWEMLRVRHAEALATAGTTGQVTALSLLVSMYLQSVYAATSEEIEIFLSPVASRSRVREAVRGLSATRQIHALSMDAQTYYFLENGLPEFAEPAAPDTVDAALPPASPAPAGPLPAPKPRPRKVQATRTTAGTDAPAAPPSRSAPIFRRPKPEPRPAAIQPGPGTDRPAPQSRPPWHPAAKPPASGPPARWAGKQGGMRPPGRSFAAASGRRGDKIAPKPERRAPRSGPYGRPGEVRPDARASARPNARGGARPSARPGPWTKTGTGTGARNKPAAKPWALPARSSSSPSRPPRAGGRGDSPFRSPQKHGDRPRNSGPSTGAREGAESFRPRAPRGDRGAPAGRANAGWRPSSRPSGRPSGRAPGRPQEKPRTPSVPGAGPSPGRPAFSSRPKERRGGPQRGGRPGGAKPARFDAGRPFRKASGPPGATGPRPASPGGAARSATPGKSDRPRPAGFRSAGDRRPGANAGSTGGEGRGNRERRPPFVPRSGPPRVRPKAGGAAGKPGKPSFRGRKPDRKKPGA
jgi:23S rRNA pseudouridine2605 synthase